MEEIAVLFVAKWSCYNKDFCWNPNTFYLCREARLRCSNQSHRIEFLHNSLLPQSAKFLHTGCFDDCLCLYTCCISSLLFNNNKNLFSKFFLVYRIVVYHFMSHYPKYINSMSDPVTITGNIWISNIIKLTHTHCTGLSCTAYHCTDTLLHATIHIQSLKSVIIILQNGFVEIEPFIHSYNHWRLRK